MLFKIVSRKLLVVFIMLLSSIYAFSGQSIENTDEVGAKAFIQTIISALEVQLITAKEEGLLSDDEYLNKLISDQIFPYIDIPNISKKIIGSYWQEVQKSDQELAMQQAIKASLQRTYRVALASYNGEKIAVGQSKDNAKYSLVRVSIATTTSKHRLDFALKQLVDSSWLIFDVSVDGIVFSKTMRSSLKPMFENNTVKEVIYNLTGK